MSRGPPITTKDTGGGNIGWLTVRASAPAAADSDTLLLREFAEAVKRLAFEMPPPNPYTPRFVQMAQSALYLSHQRASAAVDTAAAAADTDPGPLP